MPTGYTGVMRTLKRTASTKHASRSDRFLFISGRLCLDFVHTGGADERQRFEEWYTPRDLAEWLAASSLQIAGIEVSADDLDVAYALREAIWHTALACIHHDPLPPTAIECINQVARGPDLAPQFVGEHAYTFWTPSLTAPAALSTVARDAIALFTGEQARLIRQCANPRCLLLFVDASRPGKRRWCSMDRCGNRAKTATYRQHHHSRNAQVPHGD